jgi:hypothetical protein
MSTMPFKFINRVEVRPALKLRLLELENLGRGQRNGIRNVISELVKCLVDKGSSRLKVSAQILQNLLNYC